MEKLFIIIVSACFIGLFLSGAALCALFIPVWPLQGWTALSIYVLVCVLLVRAHRIKPVVFPCGIFTAGDGI